MSGLDRCRVVLVEPSGAGNVGSLARAMLNLGFGKLVLVRPICDVMSEEARKMALAGIDLIRNAEVFDDLASALKPCAVTVAATRRLGRGRRATFYPRELASKLSELGPDNGVALVFGREDRGLSNEDINLCQYIVTIPAEAGHDSFNLAQAALVVLWEIASTVRTSEPLEQGRIASHEELAGMYNDLRDVMDKIGFLAKGNADRIMTTLGRMIGGIEPTGREVRIVRGALRDLRWYVRQVAAGKLPPLDDGKEE